MPISVPEISLPVREDNVADGAGGVGDNQVTRLNMGGMGGMGGMGMGGSLKLNLAALSEPPDAVSGLAPSPDPATHPSH